MYQGIRLDEKFNKYHCKSQFADENIIDQLSRINIFIGSNNSGKSRLLRHLFANNDYSYIPKAISLKEYKDTCRMYERHLIIGFRESAIHLRNEIKIEIIQAATSILDNIVFLRIDQSDLTSVINSTDSLMEPLAVKKKIETINHITNITNITNRIVSVYRNQRDIRRFKDSLLNEYNSQIEKFTRHYIPTLRSLKGLSPKEEIGINAFNDVYKEKTIEEYFSKTRDADKLNIFTGLTLYEDTTRLLLGNTEDRNKVRKFEEFLQDAFFDDEVNIVPHLASKTIHVKIGNKEHPIHELGDGIQSIIILTYPLFMHEGENAVFFFEEPETHLHPGYQRLFMETLLKDEFSNYQYFMTTHSNHFLDITLDYNSISVYALNRHSDEDEFDLENVTSVDDNVLKLIGARTSSVFLSNCTIWVEGITDRIYIRKYLEIYQKSKKRKFKEDYHYSFVEYAGNNITHWSFLDSEDENHPNINVDRLCSKLFLITDNDGAGRKLNGDKNLNKEKKYNRHIKLKEKLKDRYCLLKCREIENLLKKEVIEQVIRGYEPNEEGLDFTRFYNNNHEGELLGKFIEEHVKGLERKYRYKSDTINDKLKFAKAAVNNINTLDDLSEEAKQIADRLYNFIKENNS